MLDHITYYLSLRMTRWTYFILVIVSSTAIGSGVQNLFIAIPASIFIALVLGLIWIMVRRIARNEE